MSLQTLAQLGLLPPPPQPPEGPKWTEKVAALSAFGSTIVGAIGYWKDIAPFAAPLMYFGFALTALFIGRPALSAFRRWQYARAESRDRADHLARFAEITSEALELVIHQLDPWSSDSRTTAHGVEQLVNQLDGKASLEPHLLRDIVRAHSMPFKALPKSVTSAQCEMAARILDEGLHRFVDALPRYLLECEKVAAQQSDGRGTYVFEQTNLLRDRVNELIREYNLLAKKGREEGFSWLNVIDPAKFLRAPARLPHAMAW